MHAASSRQAGLGRTAVTPPQDSPRSSVDAVENDVSVPSRSCFALPTAPLSGNKSAVAPLAEPRPGARTILQVPDRPYRRTIDQYSSDDEMDVRAVRTEERAGGTAATCERVASQDLQVGEEGELDARVNSGPSLMALASAEEVKLEEKGRFDVVDDNEACTVAISRRARAERNRTAARSGTPILDTQHLSPISDSQKGRPPSTGRSHVRVSLIETLRRSESGRAVVPPRGVIASQSKSDGDTASATKLYEVSAPACYGF